MFVSRRAPIHIHYEQEADTGFKAKWAPLDEIQEDRSRLVAEKLASLLGLD